MTNSAKMTNANYEMDHSEFISNTENEFLDFVREREDNSEWIEATVCGISVGVQSFISPDSSISDQAKSESLYYISSNEIGNFYLRDIAIPSLLERADIGGYALNRLSKDNFADVVSKCLATSRNNDTTKIRVQDGKVAAMMASSYRIIPQPKLYEETSAQLKNKFGGYFESGIWTHKMSCAEYNVDIPTKDYNDIFKIKGLNFTDIIMSLKVVTSDAGYSGVNLYPIVVGIMPNGKRFNVPILGSLSMNHTGKASIAEYSSNIGLAFAQCEKSKTRIEELNRIRLNFPFNCFCNILQKIGIRKKQAMDILNQFAVTTGNTGKATAADIYFSACEINFNMDATTLQTLETEECIARILKLSDKAWSSYDKPINCWSFNI